MLCVNASGFGKEFNTKSSWHVGGIVYVHCQYYQYPHRLAPWSRLLSPRIHYDSQPGQSLILPSHRRSCMLYRLHHEFLHDVYGHKLHHRIHAFYNKQQDFFQIEIQSRRLF